MVIPPLKVTIELRGYVWQDGPPTETGWFWIEVPSCDGPRVATIEDVDDPDYYREMTIYRHCGPLPEPADAAKVGATSRPGVRIKA